MTTPDAIKEALRRAVDENKTRYAPSSGVPELRQAIAAKVREKNAITAGESDVIVLNGGMQGLFGAFQATYRFRRRSAALLTLFNPIKDLVSYCLARTALVPTSEARSKG